MLYIFGPFEQGCALVLYVWMAFVVPPCHAQSRRLIKEKYELLITVNGHKFHQVNGRKRNIFFDDKCIDSTGVKVTALALGVDGPDSYVYGHKFVELLGEENSYKETLFRIDKNGVVPLNSFFLTPFFFTGTQIFHQSNFRTYRNSEVLYNRNFFKTNVLKFENSNQFKVDEILKVDSSDHLELNAIYEISHAKIIATFSVCEYGACSRFRYILFDIRTGQGRELNLNTAEPENEYYSVALVEHDESSCLVEVSNYSGKPQNSGYFIWDLGYKTLTEALEPKRKVIGSNYVNGEVISKNVKTLLDDRSEAVCTYSYSLQLERGLYRIFRGEALLDQDLVQSSEHELDLLRNMVFAKHNYKFKNEFYQAYFNSYKFYWQPQFSTFEHERKARLDDVNLLLTETDKHNLAKIQSFEAKMKN